MTHKLDSAEQLLGGYLHQDWPQEFSTADAAVTAMIDAELPETRRAAVAEIEGLLAAESDEAALRRALIDGAGCYYDPTADGSTYREWLESVAERLSA